MIFCFGSNLGGKHGRGAAASAMRYENAVYGQGVGPQGTAYAIPTKGWNIETLPISEIKNYVDQFLNYARINNHVQFLVTKIGCGLAGLKEAQMAPLFELAPDNCILPHGWRTMNGQKEV